MCDDEERMIREEDGREGMGSFERGRKGRESEGREVKVKVRNAWKGNG